MSNILQPTGKTPPNLIRAVVARISLVFSSFRRIWVGMSHAGVEVASDALIEAGVEFKVTDGGVLSLGPGIHVSRGVSFTIQGGAVHVGARSFIGRWTTIVARRNISIGKDCLIAERVTIRDQDHRIHGVPEIPIRDAGMEAAEIRIGNNVWIAAGAVLLKGISIGDGAVIAANSVVRTDVPARAIAAGAPACIVGHRRSGT